ncbi:hypothetical protein IV203_012860 [Nitzschia inconspicua]|uniref:Uncharacterized protein n=1 Tax=Nitzschia inconspicua TaxID=303405 RepID=A0A9K3Q8A4_9STRA|nr:hypothetical protein IV203_012860 [Nitzschia inconspicua]
MTHHLLTVTTPLFFLLLCTTCSWWNNVSARPHQTRQAAPAVVSQKQAADDGPIVSPFTNVPSSQDNIFDDGFGSGELEGLGNWTDTEEENEEVEEVYEEYTSGMDNLTDDDDDLDGPVDIDRPDVNATMVTIASDGDATFSVGNTTSSVVNNTAGEEGYISVSATTYSVLTFPIDTAELILVEDQEPVVAVMCLEREPVPGGEDGDDNRTYSVCMLLPELLDDTDIESLSTEEDFVGFTMPDDCVGGVMTSFEVSSSTDVICIDVSDALTYALTGPNTDVPVIDISRTLQSSERLSFMIGASDPDLVGDGDKFYSSEDTQGRHPELTLSKGMSSVNDTDTDASPPTTPSVPEEEYVTIDNNQTMAPTDERTNPPSEPNNNGVNVITPPTDEPTSGATRIVSSMAISLMVGVITGLQ